MNNNRLNNNFNSIYHPGRSNRGISLTEIMVGIALFMLAVIPSISYLFDTLKQSSSTEMENTAGLIAQSILDRLLDNMPFDSVNSSMTNLDEISGMSDEDGAANNKLKIKGQIYDIEIEVNTIKSDTIKFSFRRTPYIKRQTTTAEYAEAGNDISTLIKDDKKWKNKIDLKLKDITRHADKDFIKEIKLKISWKDKKNLKRSYEFVTMKTNLTLVKNEGG
ncbi:MAG: hypothetical protein QMC67_06405 [Candidatus Wallbacteria bacterium]|mgnify:CR=1 FL=1